MIGILTMLLRECLFFLGYVTGGQQYPKPLTMAEEKRCLTEMATGSEDARRELILHNLRLVSHIAKKYTVPGCTPEDLTSIGTVGLIKAVDSFDPTKGIRLSSYASRCIENEILMFFRSAKKTAQDVSLNDPIDTDKDGNTLTLLDTIATDDHILEDIDLRMKVRQLYDAVKTRLSPREREIVLLRYGLTGQRPLVQREVAKKLNISRSYVSRLEKKALQKLRKAFDE